MATHTLGSDAAGGPVDKARPAFVDEYGYNHSLVHGVPYPPGFDAAPLDELKRGFRLRAGDVVVATYPKCGTTWMQQIVLALLHGGDGTKVVDCMQQAPWIEAVTCANALGRRGMDINGPPMSVAELSAWDGSTIHGPGAGRRCFKTHATVDLVPWAQGLQGVGDARLIVVSRNPKDACVSMYHHAKSSPHFEYSGNFEHFATKLFLPGKVESGCFWKFHAGWERAAIDHPNILWVSYEELKRDRPATVRKVADFLGVPAADDVVAAVLAGSDFQAMQSQRATLDQQRREKGERVKDGHLRQGLSGSWRKSIHGDVDVAFDRAHAELCARRPGRSKRHQGPKDNSLWVHYIDLVLGDFDLRDCAIQGTTNGESTMVVADFTNVIEIATVARGAGPATI